MGWLPENEPRLARAFESGKGDMYRSEELIAHPQN
jgi:hypothetical protein